MVPKIPKDKRGTLVGLFLMLLGLLGMIAVFTGHADLKAMAVFIGAIISGLITVGFVNKKGKSKS